MSWSLLQILVAGSMAALLAALGYTMSRAGSSADGKRLRAPRR